MNKIILSFVLLVIITATSFGQVGIGTTTPHNSAVLELNSTVKGFLPPRMTAGQKNLIVTPQKGLQIYLTDSAQGIYAFNGLKWTPAGSGFFVDLVSSQVIDGSKTFSEDIYTNDLQIGRGFSNSGNIIVGKDGLFSIIGGIADIAIGDLAMYSNTSGSDNIAIGKSAMYHNSTASFNTVVGSGAMYENTIGARNTAMGYHALRSNNLGHNNTATGSDALFANLSGNYNSAYGESSMSTNSSGNYNCSYGYTSLYNNYSGSYNIAMGVGALYSNTFGKENTAMGHEALRENISGENNAALGTQALYSNNSGDNNVAVGYQALYNNTAGLNNVAIGYQAMFANTTGVNNTAIGLSTFSNGTNFSNSTALGYNADVTAGNQVRIGNAAVTSIGGQVSWTTLSDGRFKKDIRETVPGLAFITALRPVVYNLDLDAIASFIHTPDSLRLKDAEKIKASMPQTGFIAQEVETVANALGFDFSGIDKPKSKDDYYGLRYAEFVVPLVKGMQEQQKMIGEMQLLIKKLEERIKTLESK